MSVLLKMFLIVLCLFLLLLVPFVKNWMSERLDGLKKDVQDKDLWKGHKEKLASLLIIIGCVVVFNIIASNANWKWWTRIWTQEGHLFSFIWIGVVYATFAWLNAEKPAVKVFATAVFVGALSAVYTVGLGGSNTPKEVEQVARVMWSDETLVGNEEVAIKSPLSRAPSRFHVKNSEGTRVLIRLHGGNAHYMLTNGERVKEIIFVDGVPEQEVVSQDWEGAVEWVGAKSLTEKVVTIVSNEISHSEIH